MIARGRLKDRIRIERPVKNTALGAAQTNTWVKVADAWAEFQDARPGRAERLGGGTYNTPRAARVIMGYRNDINATMRVVLVVGGKDVRIAQIVSEPATLGRRDGIEFVVEDYNPARKAG